jgi:hypothetical protein
MDNRGYRLDCSGKATHIKGRRAPFRDQGSNTADDQILVKRLALRSHFSRVKVHKSPTVNIVAGGFTPVLAHSKSFSLIDCISVELMQRNFDPTSAFKELDPIPQVRIHRDAGRVYTLSCYGPSPDAG